MDIEKLRFPIGQFQKPEVLTEALLASFIFNIESFPGLLKKEVYHLADSQLDTAYRPGGWTIRQVVHHCADSHMNGIIRHKLTLAEDAPKIKPYPEHLFAELDDSRIFPVSPAISLLEGLHLKWAFLLKSISESDLERIYIHPEHGRKFSFGESIAIYAWHCRHHLAHITTLKTSMRWD